MQRNAELASNSLNAVSTVSVIYDVHNGDRRPANLVRSFGELYSVARLETLDALDAIGELVDADELKNKLLFSVVVVSVFKIVNFSENPKNRYLELSQNSIIFYTLLCHF